MKIYGNTVIDCGGGIKVSGNSDAEVFDNKIHKTKVAIEVDHNFNGTIANNDIQEASQNGILVNDANPFEYFQLPSEVSRDELLMLFEKLDQSKLEDHPNIVKESMLSKLDQFTSISERVLNFTKVYGPTLIHNFGQFLSNIP